MKTLLKKGLKSLAYFFWDKKQKWVFRRLAVLEELYIFDIDNTLTINLIGEKVDHANPNPRSEMIDHVRSLISEGQAVIFLSARDFRAYSNTKKWLGEQQIWSGSRGLFLVKSASAKLPYLQIAIARHHKVTFVDDMSFNHENGQIKYYDQVVEEISKLKLNFLSLKFIESPSGSPID